MMKKMDKKKIILSVLLSSMLWSNSLYAYELTGEIKEDLEDLINNGKFVVINIDDDNDVKKNVYTTKDSKDKITINDADVAANISNVQTVKDSTVDSVYGGYSYNTNNNEIEISNSEIFNHVAGGAYGESNNHNTLIIKDSDTKMDVFGGGYGSDNNFNKITLINTTANSRGYSVAGGYYIYDSSVEKITDKITDKVNVIENEVNVIGGDIENEVNVSEGYISNLYGGHVDNSNRVIKNINVKGNNVKIDKLGESRDDREEVYNIIGGSVGGAVDPSNKDMPDEVKWNSSDNNVEIKNSYIELKTGNKYSGTNIMGGGITGIIIGNTKPFYGTLTANNNRLDIIDSYVVAGGEYQKVNGGYVSEISDNFTGFTSADNNIVNIDNSMIMGGIVAGENIKGQANGNRIIIKNNSYIYSPIEEIIGGFGKNASNNTIELNGTNTVNAHLYGWMHESSDTVGIHDNNVLKINDFSSSINGVHNFNTILFENVKWNQEPTFNTTYNQATDKWGKTEGTGGVLVTDISNIDNVKLGNISGSDLKTGDKAYLIFAYDNGSNEQELTKLAGVNDGKVENYSGVAKIINTQLLYKDNVNIIFKIDGQIYPDDRRKLALSAVVTGVERNKQVDLVAENRAVAAAFVNQGTDLIADSLDTLSRDGKYGVKTFAAVHGNRSKYDVNSDIKINGWSTIVGVGAENEHNGGDFSWGVFYENGSGNYRTYNDFNNEFFRGDGSLVYNGGGIAARYENSHGVYTEGSLRAGMLKSEMTDALSDGENKYGYESETAYYGAHIGVGKIFSLGDDSDLDVYGKFFHTYTEGDSFNVAGDEFEFDSINSDRLRIGARVTSNKENKFSTYYGLAYEYEFNGDAEMRAAGMKAPTQSLQGSSVMAEIGLNYQPTPDSPWSFDLNMRGYAGERQGGSFNVQATYTF